MSEHMEELERLARLALEAGRRGEAASLRLQLARALRQIGELDRAAAEATQAARLDPSLFDEVSALLAEML